MPDANAAVEAELQKRLACGDRRGSASGQWAEVHLREFQNAGVRWGSSSSAPFLTSPWFPTLLPREQDFLRYSMSVDPELLLRNVSQSISRLPCSSVTDDTGNHVAPAQKFSQIVWVRKSQEHCGRLLLGREALLYQAFPTALVSPQVNATPEALMQDLAGNMMSLPVVLAISMALFGSATWATTTASAAPASTDDETSSAIAAFDRILAKRPRPS